MNTWECDCGHTVEEGNAVYLDESRALICLDCLGGKVEKKEVSSNGEVLHTTF